MATPTPISRTRRSSINPRSSLAEVVAAAEVATLPLAETRPVTGPTLTATPRPAPCRRPEAARPVRMRSQAETTTPATVVTDIFYGSMVHTSIAVYDPINIAVAGYGSTSHADQSNNVLFDQSAVQMAGIGGNGGNGNAAIGGDIGGALLSPRPDRLRRHCDGRQQRRHRRRRPFRREPRRPQHCDLRADQHCGRRTSTPRPTLTRPTMSSSIRARSRSPASAATAATATRLSVAMSSLHLLSDLHLGHA